MCLHEILLEELGVKTEGWIALKSEGSSLAERSYLQIGSAPPPPPP